MAIDPRALTDKGISLGNLGNHTGAIEYYDKALAINPKYENALYNKGYDLAALANYTGAILYYDKVLAINPSDENTLSNKGLALANLGNYTGAILYYDKALPINLNDTYALDNKGVALGDLGNYTGAILYYDKTLTINPSDENALNNKGVALDNIGDYTRAILYYDKALAIDPKYEDALYNKGLALDNLRNYTGAIEFYDKALAIQPNDTYALNSKGAALNSLGNYTGAIEFYNKTLAIDPKNTFALTNKAAILDRLGNHTTTENATNFLQYDNRNYGIQIQYPSDWSIQESKSSGELINVAAFLSPTGNPFPTAEVTIYMDRLHNSTTNLNNYTHFVAFTDYENRPSDFHAFRLLELNTNSSILAGKPAHTLIGTYELHSSGLKKLMEVVGDKAYSVQYIADAPKYTDYLPTVQKMIESLQIKSQFVPIPSPTPGMEIVTGPNGTMTMTQGNSVHFYT